MRKKKIAIFNFYIQSIIYWVCLQLAHIWIHQQKKVQVFNQDEVFDQTAGIFLPFPNYQLISIH